MLQRGLPAILQWAPALTAAQCHLQQTAAQIASSLSFQQLLNTSTTSSSSSRSSNRVLDTSQQQQQPDPRGFFSKVVDVRATVPQPRRAKLPYFNPDDGPQAYQYWKDLWAKPKLRPKVKRVPKQPVYLEADEQQALIDAAVGAGIPLEIVEGDMTVRQLPRLIAAIQAKGGRIPTDPQQLADRIRQLMDLERMVPGLDLARIFKAKGFGILAQSPKSVEQTLQRLGAWLSRAGVSAEPGVLLTAAVKPVLHYPVGVVNRAVRLPEVFQSTLQAPAPASLLQNPFAANILNRSTRAVQYDMEALARRQGPAAAASMYSRLPQLLLFRHQTLRYKTAVLADALGLEASQVNALVKKHPRLLTYAAETMSERVEGLAQLLGVFTAQEQQLQELVLQQPSLLYKKTESIASKLSVIQDQLGLQDLQHAADALKTCPRLASYSAAHLQQPLQQLQQLSDSSILAPLKPKAQEILRAKPWLLTLGSDDHHGSHNSLTWRLQLLEQLAELGPNWREAVGRWAESSSSDAAVVLGHRDLTSRVAWLLQQQGTAIPAAADGIGLYEFVVMRDARFEKRYPGFIQQQQQQQHVQ